MNENRDLKATIEKLQKVIAKKEKAVEDKQEQLDGIAKVNKKYIHNNRIYKQRAKRQTRKKMAAQAETREFKKGFVKSVEYLVKDFDWDKDESRQQTVEVILRTVVTYNRLINDGIITFNELAFLLLASQREFFRLEDIRDRYGYLGWGYKRDFADLVEAGLLKKMYRKQIWHITIEGKNRLEDILRHIYENKIGVYKEVKLLKEQ